MVATRKDLTEISEGAGISCEIERVAVIQPRSPRYFKKAAPIHFKTPKAAGEALISAVIPNAERIRNNDACVKIPSTQISDVRNPQAIATLTQLTAFDPGVMTKSTQKLANMNQASTVIALINRWSNHPYGNRRYVVRVFILKQFTADTEAVPRFDRKPFSRNCQI